VRHSKRSLEGELLIDHSASPGLSPEDAAFMGVDPRLVAKGQVAEMPTITCGHCQYAVLLNPDRTRERGWCSKCDHYLCDECAALLHLTLECRTMTRQIDEAIEHIERFGTTSPLFMKP
jgi:hypothetical protein